MNPELAEIVEEILCHANSRIAQDVCQQANQDVKRSALSRFSESSHSRSQQAVTIFRVVEKRKRRPCLDGCLFGLLRRLSRHYIRSVPFECLYDFRQIRVSHLESGGDDGARTRDLCRDSELETRNCKKLGATDGHF